MMIFLPWICTLLILYISTYGPLDLEVQPPNHMLMTESMTQTTRDLEMNGAVQHHWSTTMQPPPTASITYSRTELLALGHNMPRQWIPSKTYTTLKDLGIFRYRSRRAGSHIRRKPSKLWNNDTTNEPSPANSHGPLPVHIISRTDKKTHVNHQTGVNLINLRPIPRETYSKLNVYLWNANSVRNKTNILFDYILEHDVDIMCITESWLRHNDSVVISECTPPGYSCLNVPRECESYGGGIAVVLRALSTCRLQKLISSLPPSSLLACVTLAISFDFMWCTDPLHHQGMDSRLLISYHNLMNF